MSKTLLIQSYSLPISADNWLQLCIDSVKSWADLNDFEYKFIDDALFSYVTDEILKKTKHQKVIATDLARLKVMQTYLNKGYKTVIWCDADVVIFEPEKFELIDENYVLGREVWIQKNEKNPNTLMAYKKVHNAFMMFRKGNVFLDFYADTAERLILKNNGAMPPQYIGPKLLTALHNIVQCPVLETVGMFSPLVINDIANGGGEALELFVQESTQPIYAANLCNSLFERNEYSTKVIMQCLQSLISQRKI